MTSIRKILLPTDFSRGSDQALFHAVHLAKVFSSELHMLHAIVFSEDDPYDPTYHFPDSTRVRELLEEMATDRMAALIREHDIPDLVITQVHLRGVSAAPRIVDYIQDEGIDLVVMGTHGRRGVRRLLLGSVAAEVIRLARCSVLVVRGREEAEPPGRIFRILVPVDFSEDGTAALVSACELAALLGAELQLMHVLQDVIHPAFYNLGAGKISDLKPEIFGRAETALKSWIEPRKECLEVPVRFFVREGHPGREIIRFAREHASDLVVMATHGLTGIKRFLLGSITEKVISGAECPVLVVRPSMAEGPK